MTGKKQKAERLLGVGSNARSQDVASMQYMRTHVAMENLDLLKLSYRSAVKRSPNHVITGDSQLCMRLKLIAMEVRVAVPVCGKRGPFPFAPQPTSIKFLN